MVCDILLLEPIRFMFITQMQLIDEIISVHYLSNCELRKKHKIRNKIPISHILFSLFKQYNEAL